MSHKLDPLLCPRSIAVVGASERSGSVGRRTVHNLLAGRFPGKLYAVNPGYNSVLGVPCFPNLTSLPEKVEHVVLTVGDARIEAALDDAITHGTRAATLMSSLVLEDDHPPLLRERILAKIKASGLVVCGANGMGFYHFARGVWVCGFDTRENHIPGGNVTLISHSGAGMSGIVDCEERIDFNLAVSTGQELAVTMDQYMDFALDQPETRVIGLFMESARNPEGMIHAFEKANQKAVPVVVLKVGRTDLSARLAVSHSGAIAGHDDAYQALFDRYGVQRVEDMDELTTALIMFAQPHTVPPGGLVSIHDSGGERQLLIDLAEDMNVPLATIEPQTEKKLAALLDPGLPPVNPLDAWGAGGPGSDRIMEDCLAHLMMDPNAAMGAVIHDRAPLSKIYPEYYDYMRAGHSASGKPVFLVANRQGSGMDPATVPVTREGFPVLDGLRPFLAGIRCLTRWRDFMGREMARSLEELPVPVGDTVERWRKKLATGSTLEEFEAGEMLREFGLPINPAKLAISPDEAASAAASLGYPVVLKTAQPGILHKTDVDGVVMNIQDRARLATAYLDLADRLGPRVIVSRMVVVSGVEMALGLVHDEQFGPLVMLGFGGVQVEALRDIAYALPPFTKQTARRLVDSLKLRPLLDGQRKRPAADIESFCSAAERFSMMASALGDCLDEVDINPLIVHPDGCIAVDALAVGRFADS